MVLTRHFDEAARARVAAAVQAAEAGSRGQVVPVVVERSSGYPEARFRGALLGAAAATAVILALDARFRFDFAFTLGELTLAQVAAGLLGWAAARLAPVERLLAGRHDVEESVRARALRAFADHGLHQTKEGIGVLVFASLRERRAVVLGDHGIHARVGDAEWKATVEALVAGMRRGAPADGFVAALERCGARLAEHFPRDGAAPVANELPDALKVDRT
jgi:putative membrane protein